MAVFSAVAGIGSAILGGGIGSSIVGAAVGAGLKAGAGALIGGGGGGSGGQQQQASRGISFDPRVGKASGDTQILGGPGPQATQAAKTANIQDDEENEAVSMAKDWAFITDPNKSGRI